MSRLFKIFLLVVLSFLSSFNVSANETFFSIENKGSSVEELVEGGSDLSHFLDDAFVLSKRAEVIADGLPSQFPNLTIDELTAIKVYTSDEVRNGVKIYESLNTQLRAGNLDDYNKGLSELLDNGMSKLPDNTSSSVFRGVYGDEATWAKTWSKNEIIEFKDFKSSSLSNSEALKFMTRKNGDVFYEILNPKGKNVCPVSCSIEELEILFKKGSKFNVENIQDGFNFLDPNDPLTVLGTGRKVTLRLID